MATSDIFSYVQVSEACKKLSNKIDLLSEHLKLADNLIKSEVNVDGSSVILGNVGTQLVDLWQENMVSATSLKENLDQWVSLLKSISNSYQNFENENLGLDLDAINNSSSLDENLSEEKEMIVDTNIINNLFLQISNGTLSVFDLFDSREYQDMSKNEKELLEQNIIDWMLDSERAGQYCENSSYLKDLPETFKNKVYVQAADKFYNSTYAKMIKVGSNTMGYEIYNSVPEEVKNMINDKFFADNSVIDFGKTSKFILPSEFCSYNDDAANREAITYQYCGKIDSDSTSFIIAQDTIPKEISDSWNFDYTEMPDCVAFINDNGVAQYATIEDLNGNRQPFTLAMLQGFQNGSQELLKKYDFSSIYVGNNYANIVKVNFLEDYSNEAFNLSSFDISTRPLIIVKD